MKITEQDTKRVMVMQMPITIPVQKPRRQIEIREKICFMVEILDWRLEVAGDHVDEH